MKRTRTTSIILSSLLSISIMCSTFTSFDVMAAENNTSNQLEEQSAESTDLEVEDLSLSVQAGDENQAVDQEDDTDKIHNDIASENEIVNEVDSSGVTTEVGQKSDEQPNDSSTELFEETEAGIENINNEQVATGETADEEIVDKTSTTEEIENANTTDGSNTIDSGNCGDSIMWDVSGPENDYTLTISGNGTMSDYSEEDAPWFAYSSAISTIKVEEGVTELGRYSFYSLTNLVQVFLPETIEVIKDHCFGYCTSLSKISIPKSIIVIGDFAFEGSGLTEVYYAGSEDDWNIIEIGQGNEDIITKVSYTVIERTPVIELSQNSFVYNGKIQKPELTIKVEDEIINVENYTVEYIGDCLNVGTHQIIVSLKGKYAGTETVSYKITVKKVTPTVSLSKSAYSYTGGNIKPAVTVKVGNTVLNKDQDYTVIYPQTCKNVGIYKATVKLKGNYSGTKVVSYKINPKATKLYNVVGTKDKFTVKWYKQTTQVTGYQIQYSLKSNFASGNKSVLINKNSINVKTVKKPTAGKNYYVRVRTYKTVSGKKYYSSWSNAISTVTKRTLQNENSITLGENGGSYTYRFRITNRMIAMAPVKIRVTGEYITKGGFRIILKDSNDKTWQNDYVSLKEYEKGDEFESWFYSDGGLLPPGDYYYTLKNTSDDTIKVTFSTFGFAKKSTTASIKKTPSTRSGSWVTLGKITDGLPLVKSIKCSGSNLIDDWYIDYDGTVYVWAEKKGTSNVVITLASGKKFTTKLNVTAGDPNFMAYVNGYYTRDNYFTVKIKNLRGSDLIIVREGGKVENYDYKSLDRWIKNSGNITIKSGETKTVRFYLKGTPTYPDYMDFDLHAKFIFEGKTYVWHTWRNDSVFKKNNGWYNTYWDEDAYDGWS